MQSLICILSFNQFLSSKSCPNDLFPKTSKIIENTIFSLIFDLQEIWYFRQLRKIKKICLRWAFLWKYCFSCILHENWHCIFCNNISRFLYILVSSSFTVSPCQSSDWYRQTFNCLQGDVSWDYQWKLLQMANSVCAGGSTHQQELGESQGYWIDFCRDWNWRYIW